MAEPKLTVVINVRNGMPYIEETLHCLLNQSEPVSILVVDNQSTDGTDKLVKKIPGVQYVKTPESLTLGGARAFSLGLVKSEYVSWLDADDLWDLRFAGVVLKAFRKEPTAVFVTTGTGCIDSQGKRLGYVDSYHRKYYIPWWRRDAEKIEAGDSLAGLLLRMRPKWAWCACVFKTESVKQVGGFNQGLSYCTDLDLIGKVLGLGPAFHLSQNLTWYRRHPASDTQRLDPQVIYEEKLRVVFELDRKAQTLSPVVRREMEQLTRLKCAAVRFFRQKTLKNGIDAVRQTCRPALLRYLWRRFQFNG